jgi:hypothetical protein
VQQHHRDAIERWTEAAAADDEVLAVVVAGSLTKGYGLADSDVDGFVIVTDEAFARRRASGELTFFSTDLCDYEGGYVDALVTSSPVYSRAGPKTTRHHSRHHAQCKTTYRAA